MKVFCALPILIAFSSCTRLVFRDDFNSWNADNYTIAVTASGGGNNEFQIYTNDAANIFTRNGYLYIKPTFSVDHYYFNEWKLYNGVLNTRVLWGSCTDSNNHGCYKTAHGEEILNPVMSGKITTKSAIRYGKITVRAKLPKGDWLWPAIWLLPRDNHYGGWPRSGDFDIVEARGNVRAVEDGVNQGINQIKSALNWGPDYMHNGISMTVQEKRKTDGDYHGWYKYSLEWTADNIRTLIDDQVIMDVPTPLKGFWSLGNFSGYNIWQNGDKNAPFDQYVIMNVAVGGNFFSDAAQYEYPKPWQRHSVHPMRDFWERRALWQGTWGSDDDRSLVVDFIEMIEY